MSSTPRAAQQPSPSSSRPSTSRLSNDRKSSSADHRFAPSTSFDAPVPSQPPSARSAVRYSNRRYSQYYSLYPKLQTLLEEHAMTFNPQQQLDDGRDFKSLMTTTDRGPVTMLKIGGPGTQFTINIFLPWMQLNVVVGLEAKLNFLKKGIFEKLDRMMVESFSKLPHEYVFRAYTTAAQIGETQELFNEEVRLCEIPFTEPFSVLFLHEPEGTKDERDMMATLQHIIGHPIAKIDEETTEELRYYKQDLFNITLQATTERGTVGYDHYAFPEATTMQVENTCPESVIVKVKGSHISYHLYHRSREAEMKNADEEPIHLIVDFVPNDTPHSLVAKVMKDLSRRVAFPPEDEQDEFLLQLAGQRCYLTSDIILLVNYEFVRSQIENYRQPKFVLRRKSMVMKDYPVPRPIHKPLHVRALESRPAVGRRKREAISLWDVEENLSFRVLCVSNVDSFPDAKIFVNVYVYCGKTRLSQSSSGKISPSVPRWPSDDIVEFELCLKDLPPASILAIELIESRPKKGKQLEDRAIGWAMMRLFDWRNELVEGQFTMQLNPGALVPPPDGEIGCAIEDRRAPHLTVMMMAFESIVRFPDEEIFKPFIEEGVKWGKLDPPPLMDMLRAKADNEKVYEKLSALMLKFYNDTPLSEEEERFVWDWRYFIHSDFPDAIVVLADTSILWSERENFVELYTLLDEWPTISAAAAIALLSKRSTDRIIRRFAVSHLASILDERTFPLFLLPLIQSLKNDPFASNHVTIYLLRMALSYYGIGHKLFWLLRAELAEMRQDRRISEGFLRIVFFIEAYMRGNIEHVQTISKDIEMVEILSKLSSAVKGCRDKDTATKRLREELRSVSYRMEYIDSPLDPTNRLGELLIDSCRVLGSAKMPLFLKWRNVSPLASLHLPTYEIIYKNGDDLRQDMLVLHVLEIMNTFWKRLGKDYCLCPYPVLPMAQKEGMIGVVPNCVTIFEIQSEGGKSMGTAVRSLETTFLNKYLRNTAGQNSREYLECVDRFLMSCVGYSIATYVMGIKDRHSDNIMLTRDGRLFHIDFGHILGHGKTKLGIQRDRVPFILTEHFICVIMSGNPVAKDAHEVKNFKKKCIEAYLTLWDERDLFISVFNLMQSMKLPELSTEGDLAYLKTALHSAIDDRESAEKFFGSIFEEAFNGSWSTKTNWFFHAVKHM